ncbi:MAG: LysM peptidoglycan-binding domain-containing protein [Anaerolineaceae bacterium]
MNLKIRFLACLSLIVLMPGFAFSPGSVEAESESPVTYQAAEVTAYDLIAAMNSLRMSYGLPALIEDPIIDAVAQGTAQIMADGQLSWHIGDVPGRLTNAGYGGGGKVYATENFAIGYGISINEIMDLWSDESHMLPAVKSYYCNVGAGTAKAANGSTYYILQAAYVSGKECGTYTPPGDGTGTQTPGIVPGIITPVKVATPDATGQIIHEVKAGQSFWAIAVAYGVSIKDILQWNNLPDGTTLQIGDKLVIPGPNSEGYQTPTPVGFFTPSPPEANGKIVHTVGAYQNLTVISTVYNVTIERILTLNGLTVDTPLQIDQKLLIDPGMVTPTPTPSPTLRPLTPIEKLTPASDGNYYHTVGDGQNLSWIANYYGISITDLMSWNNKSLNSILYVGDLLLLKVTPPATLTPTALPPTATLLPTVTSPPTNTPIATTLPNPTPPVLEDQTTSGGGFSPLWLIPIVGIGLAGYWIYRSKKRKANGADGSQDAGTPPDS